MRRTVELQFPLLNGGQAQGLNDAGVETFQGSVDVHLARECGQNTGDAKRKDVSAARLAFDRLELDPSKIPAFSEVREALKASRTAWETKEKERKFFDDAIALASGKAIPVLRIRDTGTTGLSGDDTDAAGRWYALVKSQGLSNKDDTSAGSFGIGKSSPFAASRFRTVFYGTRLADGSSALQGVCRLVTHRNKDGRQTQGTGFIGTYDPDGDSGDPVFRAVRTAKDIPSAFERADQGTDVWVIGYRSGSDWDKDLTKSILSNFWPAIHQGSLVFEVDGSEISRENYAELIERFAGEPDFDAHHYYRAILTKPTTRRLKQTGTAELYLTAHSADLPKKICMIRGNGMRIYDYAPRACRVPFAGLFICTDSEGNKLLRQMEPPRHDRWEEGRVEGTLGRRALKEIKDWIREEVKALNPFFKGQSFNETELAKYLPDDLEDTSPELQEDSGDAADEKLEPRPASGAVPTREAPVRPSTVLLGEDPDVGGGAGPTGTESGSGQGGGGGEGRGPEGGDEESRAARVHLRLRGYAAGSPGEYAIVVRSDKAFRGSILLSAIGEDGEREPLSLLKASIENGDGRTLSIQSNRILGVSLAAGEPVRMRVWVEAITLRAITGVAAA